MQIIKKFKAIWRIIYSDHFYLITANGSLQIEEIWDTTNKTNYTISAVIHLYWQVFWKRTFLSKLGNEQYI